MAFYKNVPNTHAHKKDYAKEGRWEEEGASYRKHGGQGGYGERSDDFSGKRRNGTGEHSRDFRNGTGEHSRDFRNGAGEHSRDIRNGTGEHSRDFRSGTGEHSRDFRGTGFTSSANRGSSFGHSSFRKDRPAGDRSEAPRFSENRRPGSFHSEDRRPGEFRSQNGDRRPAFRAPRAVEAQPEKKSYLDYQQELPAAPAPEKDMPQDNILSGRNPIREALKSGRDIEKLLVQRGELSGSAREIVYMAREAHVPVQEVEKTRLDEIAPHHQGMIAFASAYAYSTVEAMLADAKEKNEDPFLILLDGVTDPHNLGAIIRSAECVGAHGVIVPERRSVGLTPAAVKASAGAIEHMKVARVTNLNRTIEQLKEHGIWAYAVTMDGQDYETVNFKGGVALVIGAEGEGISRLTEENCDTKVSLPMHGSIDSLNASVAAGIMMYRVLSSRKKA